MHSDNDVWCSIDSQSKIFIRTGNGHMYDITVGIEDQYKLFHIYGDCIIIASSSVKSTGVEQHNICFNSQGKIVMMFISSDISEDFLLYQCIQAMSDFNVFNDLNANYILMNLCCFGSKQICELKMCGYHQAKFHFHGNTLSPVVVPNHFSIVMYKSTWDGDNVPRGF